MNRAAGGRKGAITVLQPRAPSYHENIILDSGDEPLQIQYGCGVTQIWIDKGIPVWTLNLFTPPECWEGWMQCARVHARPPSQRE